MIAIGSDHVGIGLKQEIMRHLQVQGRECVDVGTHSSDSVHYPDYARIVGQKVATGECEKGILICGTGIGMSIAANKIKGVRCVVCSEPYSAEMSRLHNDSNVLALGSRVVGTELAKTILDWWLQAEYQGERHQIRVDMISDLESLT